MAPVALGLLASLVLLVPLGQLVSLGSIRPLWPLGQLVSLGFIWPLWPLWQLDWLEPLDQLNSLGVQGKANWKRAETS